MPLVPLDIPPGVIIDGTEYDAGPKWVGSNLIRFRDNGDVEKVGGWVKDGTYSFTGVPRRMEAWRGLTGDDLIAVSTSSHLHGILNGVLYDITPIRADAVGLATDPFDVTSGSPTVTVSHTSNGGNDGDYVRFRNASAGGGITVDGEYQMDNVSANAYEVTHSSNASSSDSTTGGTDVTVEYNITSGAEDAVAGLGWGISGWGGGGWGSPSGVSVTTALELQLWSLDIWGTLLIAQKRGGATYEWDHTLPGAVAISGATQANPCVVTTAAHSLQDNDTVVIASVTGMTDINGTWVINVLSSTTYQLLGKNTSASTAYSSGGTSTLERRRATVVTNSPTTGRLALVSVPDRHLVVFGAHDGSNDDPLLVHWSDQEDRTTWTAAAGNTAGTQRLAVGNKILGAVRTRDQILILTDDALYDMVFQGPPFTFGFRLLGVNCGLSGQNAIIDQDGVVYWMGCQNFYRFSGRIEILDCPVRDYVFDDIATTQLDKVHCGLNTRYNEIWFFYPSDSQSGDECDRYAKLNYKLNVWDVGEIDRSSWIDEKGSFDLPHGTDARGNLYSHENGTDDDLVAMASYIETGEFEITLEGEGERLFMIDKLVNDLDLTGSVDLTVYVRKYPEDDQVTKGPFTISSSSNTNKVSFRARGRQVALRWDADALGDDFRLGKQRINITPSGKR